MSLSNHIRRLLQALKGEAAYLYGTRFGAIFLQSITLFVVAAAIGIEEFGRFTFMFSASQIMTVVLGAGSPLFLQRTLPARDVHADGLGNANLVGRCLLRSAVLTTIFLGALLGLELYMHGEISLHEASEGRLILLAGFLLSVLQIFIAVVRVARSATYSMLLRDVLPYFAFLIGLAISVALGFKSAEISMLLFSVAVCIAAVVAVMSSLKYLAVRVSRNRADMSGVGKYMLFWGSSITGSGLAQIDILLARAFLDDRALGIYALLRRVSNLISMPQVIANWTINVRVAKDFERGDKEALQRHANYGLLLSLPVAAAMFLIIAISSPIWLGFFQVDVSIGVLMLLLVLMVAQLINVLAGANALFAVQCKEEAYIFKLRLITLLMSASVMSLGAIYFASMGIAIGTLLGMVIMNGLLIYRIQKKVGIWTSISIKSSKRE